MEILKTSLWKQMLALTQFLRYISYQGCDSYLNTTEQTNNLDFFCLFTQVNSQLISNVCTDALSAEKVRNLTSL